MAVRTNIAWCDSTHNHWIGCTGISPACDNCYAEALMDHRLHKAKWGAGQARTLTAQANREQPHKWNKKPFYECFVCGWRGDKLIDVENAGKHHCPECASTELSPARRRVFCSSLSDVFDNEVPIEWFIELLDTIRLTPNLDWLLLTKRIGNVAPRLEAAWHHLLEQPIGEEPNAAEYLAGWIEAWIAGVSPLNVWLGATVCNQDELNRDGPKLRAAPARVRFLSIEPILSRVDLCEVLDIWWNQTKGRFSHGMRGPYIDWVIVGGESGANARSVIVSDWIRAIAKQCAAAGIAFLFKQWGCWLPDDQNPDLISLSGGALKMPKEKAGRLLDGVEYNGFPRAAA